MKTQNVNRRAGMDKNDLGNNSLTATPPTTQNVNVSTSMDDNDLSSVSPLSGPGSAAPTLPQGDGKGPFLNLQERPYCDVDLYVACFIFPVLLLAGVMSLCS